MTHRERLERELASLRATRVDLRRRIDLAKKQMLHGNATDNLVARRNFETVLRASDLRWGELHHELGISSRLGGSVKLPAPARRTIPARSRSDYIRKVIV